ncbi:MAG: GntR family transcriptional regulator [Pseudooceanicola sp.]
MTRENRTKQIPEKTGAPRVGMRSESRKRSPSQAPTGPARFSSPSASHSAEVVYEKLYTAIASMELPPGTPMSELTLTEEFGVSRTPIREALQRLAKEKLVEIVPKSGTFVGRIPISALIEAIVARRALEATTVRNAVQRATPDDIARLRDQLAEQRSLAEAGDLTRFHAADEAFHAAIAEVAGYPGIWDIIRSLKIQVDRYRQLTLPQTGRLEKVLREHTAVVDAMAVGEADRAARAMEEHLDKLQLDIEIFGQTWPDYFIHDRKLDG